ncbi:phenylalanine--tRNA ligase subunit beta [bacterium]|nr:phenylalanine--tRNA ligase subunit beta [bacterium]
MIISLSELNRILDEKLSIDVVSDALTMIGLEVDGVADVDVSHLDSKIVVGKIEKIENHPNADKLQICSVNSGSELLQIVCGGSNIKEGDNVPLAQIGANLKGTDKFPDGLKIKKSKIREIFSYGMLCSSSELGLGYEYEDGIFILPEDLDVGEEVGKLHFLNDSLLDISVTPNRGDCLSYFGVCRELSAVLECKFNNPLYDDKSNYRLVKKLDDFSVKIGSPETTRYALQKVENIKLGPSPFWLKNFLAKMNMGSINNIVDISNFFMLITGHPIHIFDIDKIVGEEILVNVSTKGEIETLKDETKKTEGHLVISDGAGPIAIAGIVGGKRASVNLDTKNVLIECASFDSSTIRKSSKSLNTSTESSYRFERHVSEFSIKEALFYASSLVKSVCSGNISEEYFDSNPNIINDRKVLLELDKVSKVLGEDISKKEIISILESLSICAQENMDDKNLETSFSIPDYRFDLDFDYDLIEEVARIKGFASINPVLPTVSIRESLINPLVDLRSLKLKARESFSQEGFSEVINFSFTDDLMFKDLEKIEVLNPISKDFKYLRSSLVPSLLNNAAHNLNHGNDRFKLFEIGNIFFNKKKKKIQRMEVATISSVDRSNLMWDKIKFDFYDGKKILEKFMSFLNLNFDKISFNSKLESFYSSILHPGKAASIYYEDNNIGFVGEVHPEVLSTYNIKKGLVASTFFLDEISKITIEPKTLKPFGNFPFIQRDVSLLIDKNIEGMEVVQLIENFDSSLVKDAFIFDVFEDSKLGPNKKSLSISILFGANNRTLEDVEVTDELENILSGVKKEINIEIRE